MSKLGESIKGKREVPTISDVREAQPEPQQEEMFGADEWQKETAMDVPDVVRNDPRYKDCRFRWLSPSVIGTRGWRRWKTVHVTAAPDEINSASTEFQKQVDTVVRRGDLILAFMPESLARARERYYAKMNTPQAWEKQSRELLRERMRKSGAEEFGNIEARGIRSRKVYKGE